MKLAKKGSEKSLHSEKTRSQVLTGKAKAEFLEDKKKTLTDSGKEFLHTGCTHTLATLFSLGFPHFSRMVWTAL